MKQSLLIVLLVCASQALAGPNIRVNIDAEGDGSGLILQAYTTCLRNSPGVVVVPLGQPADALIEINSVILKTKAGEETGYAWAVVAVDAVTNVLLGGPALVTAGSHQAILQQAARRPSRVSTVMFSFLYAIDQTTRADFERLAAVARLPLDGPSRAPWIILSDG